MGVQCHEVIQGLSAFSLNPQNTNKNNLIIPILWKSNTTAYILRLAQGPIVKKN